MKTQTQLSELDATKLALLRARQQTLDVETQALFASLLATYGNPDEALAVAEDGRTLVRKAVPVPPPAPKGKRKR